MSNRSKLREKLYTSNEYGVVYQDPVAVLAPDDIAFAKKEWNINTDVHRTCINCQIRQMLKYEGMLDPDTGENYKTFKVPCSFIPKGLPPGSAETLRKMTEEDGLDRERALLLLQSAIDPVAWVELMFGFNDNKKDEYIRSYQKEQLRCSSKRIVIREGRRAGKTFVVALKLLYYMFNRTILSTDNENNVIETGPTIMIVTPRSTQLVNIFNELEKLLKKNKDLAASVTTSSQDSLFVRSPYFHMDFTNGGTIGGFVSGVGNRADGSGGGSMRGQSAHIIYLDEMDMISDDTIEKVVLPILLSDLSGEGILIATSTPIGKRGKFYTWCLESPNFKEDHLPTTILPHWHKVKSLLLADTTEEARQIEYMALFIDTGHGAFKPSYVYRAQQEYDYDNTPSLDWWRKTFGLVDSKEWIRVIGIDWNKNAGAEFVTVTYLPNRDKYILTDCTNIPGGEFSGLRWQEEVIRLNHKWKPDFIYADEGYGQTVIEFLHLHARNLLSKSIKSPIDLETIKLSERLKAYNFSSKVTLFDPLTSQEIEKHAKDFLVENARRIFENPGTNGNGVVWIPKSDQQIRNELLHYTELKRSLVNNRPIYGTDSPTIGDHRLDAFMLALAGISIEFGAFSRNIAHSNPTHISKDLLEEKERGISADQIIKGLERSIAGGRVNILSIHRDYEMPVEEHKVIRRRKHSKEEENSLARYFKELPTQDKSDMPNPKIINRSTRLSSRRRR